MLDSNNRPEAGTYIDQKGKECPLYKLSKEERDRIVELLCEDGEYYGKYCSDFPDEVCEAIHLACNSGDEELNKLAVMIVSTGSEALIKQRIQHFGVQGHFDDYYQDAQLSILENLHYYDPKKAASIATLILWDINSKYLTGRNNERGPSTTKHMGVATVRVNKAIEEMRLLGVPERNLSDPEAIAAYINYKKRTSREIAVQTVAHCLAAAAAKKTVAFTDCSEIPLSSTYGNPLKAAIENETSEEIMEAISSLGSTQRGLVEALMEIYQDKSNGTYVGSNSEIPFPEVAARYRRTYNAEITDDQARQKLRGALKDLQIKIMPKHQERKPVTVNGFSFESDSFIKQENADIMNAAMTDLSHLFGYD